MSNLENANSPVPVSPTPLRTWDFMETTLVALIAYGVNILASGLALTIMLAILNGAKPSSSAQLQAYGVALIVSSPLTIAVLWIAIRIAGRDFAEYLALNWPSSGELRHALAVTALLLSVEVLALSVVGADKTWFDPYVNAERAGFFILLIDGCITGPVMEEFIFRGFMFRGWSQSFLGPVGAVVVTSLVWAVLHTQYDWFGRFWIFVMGLALGHFRWRSNSTWLAVMVHSAMNIVAVFLIGL
jgi:membrane protease YdiL (CAAX protease family)